MRDPGRERLAIVVGRQDWGETDRILRLIVPDEGRVGVFQRSGQKKPAGLDIGVRARVWLRARAEGLHTLTDTDVEDARIHLRTSYARLALAQYACEVAGGFVHEGQPEPKQYALLDTMLLVLDHTTCDPGRALLAAFELKVLTFAGVSPELTRALPRLEELRRGRLADIVDADVDADAERLVYGAICEQLGREPAARSLLEGIEWPA